MDADVLLLLLLVVAVPVALVSQAPTGIVLG